MATMTISLPDAMKVWIENLTQNGEYSSSSDYVRDLIRRDREKRFETLSIDEVREIIIASKNSGISKHSIEQVFAQAQEIVSRKSDQTA